MVSRKGTLLERNVEQLLKLSGFKPEPNKIYNGYEIDVFLSYNNLKIAFECKQYERSTLAIRNLIHQWDSKNKELKFDKIILVLVGCDISDKDYLLAKKYGMVIWDEKKLTVLLDEAIDKKSKNKNQILNEMELKPESVTEVKEDKDKIVQTEQQRIMKEVLDKMIKKITLTGISIGNQGRASVTFKENETGFGMTYSIYLNGFVMSHTKIRATEAMKSLLQKLQFKEVSNKYLYELNIKEFVSRDDALHAQFGINTGAIAYITDRIFRDIFKVSDGYMVSSNTAFNDS